MPYAAMALEGTKWKAISVPVPKRVNKGWTSYYLDAVSCATAAYCLVAANELNDDTAPYMLTWNGTRLALTPVPPVPGGDHPYEIDAVSCVAVKSCVVFGLADTPDHNAGLWAWTWNGSKWAVRGTAFPARWGDVSVSSADCFSLTSCEVAGRYQASTTSALFATWNGEKFTLQRTSANLAGNWGVTDISCVSPRSCAALSTANYRNFLAVWNGKTWTSSSQWTGPPYSNSYLNGVSCAAADNCLAVGSSTRGAQIGGAVSFVWNGTKWREAGVPGIGPGLQTSFDDVSCPKADRCVAVGRYNNYLLGSGWSLFGYWNGRSWKLTGA
jgi:hypothetical protein